MKVSAPMSASFLQRDRESGHISKKGTSSATMVKSPYRYKCGEATNYPLPGDLSSTTTYLSSQWLVHEPAKNTRKDEKGESQ
jgi:hypothetical protein